MEEKIHTATIGGKVYEVPPLTAEVLEECEAECRRYFALEGLPLGEDARAVSVLLHRAIAQKFPAITLDEVRKGLDVRGIAQALEALTRAFGFIPRAAAEVVPGEAGGPSSSTGPT